MLYSNFSAAVEQPVSYTSLPMFCYPLGVLVPEDLGLHTFLPLFSCRHLLQDTLQEWDVQSLPGPDTVLCQSHRSGSAGAAALLCHGCSSTCCCSTWSPPLWLFREKATPLYFQHLLILCVSTQKLKFYSKAWNVCKNGRAGSREVHGPRAALSSCDQVRDHRSCMKYGCQSVMDCLIHAFTSVRPRAFCYFCYSLVANLI